MQSSFAHIFMCAHTRAHTTTFWTYFYLEDFLMGNSVFRYHPVAYMANKWYVIAEENDTPRKAKLPIPWFS